MTEIKAVILAGGQGTRFWPISRKKLPKQFLSLGTSEESLIQATARRAAEITAKENILVVGSAEHKAGLLEHVPFATVIGEPVGRNTAPAMGLAALHVRHMSPESVMVIMPADHVISQENKFKKTILEAAEIAGSHDVLVTVGINPTFPHTGYGYIQRGNRIEDAKSSRGAYVVSRFYEKPSLQRARTYFSSDQYYWNAGIFLWRPDVLLRAISDHMPELYSGLMEIDDAIGSSRESAVVQKVFDTLESISIDFGVMEHVKNAVVVDAEEFGWNDIGSWDAWAEHFETDDKGNLIRGEALLIDSADCIVHSEHRLIAVLGAEDLVVIDSGDAVLVCPREHVQNVKKVVTELAERGRNDLI